MQDFYFKVFFYSVVLLFLDFNTFTTVENRSTEINISV